MSWSEPNRIAAEAVLVAGGTVHIRLKGQQDDQPIKAVAELPSEDYQLTRVSLAGVQKPLDDAWLRLMALSDPKFDRFPTGVRPLLLPGSDPTFYRFSYEPCPQDQGTACHLPH